MSNLTFEHHLLKEHPPEPLEGHAVVVFRRVGKTGEEFHSVLLPGAAPVKQRRRRAVGESAGYFAYAVDTAPERHLEFSERMYLGDDAREFHADFELAYAVSDARVLAQSRNTDPLRTVRDRAQVVVKREMERLPWEAVWKAFPLYARETVDDCTEELREFARRYGIAIRSLQLTLHRPEIEGIHFYVPPRPPTVRSEGRRRRTRGGEMLGGWPETPWNGVECGLGGDVADDPGGTRGEMDDAPRPVLLGGSAPRHARPGDVILVQFAAYVAEFERQARQVLEREALPEEVRLGEETDCQWAVGTRVSVRCRAQGLTVPTPVQSFVWNGECRAVSFDLEVPADARPRRTVIVMEAFVHDRADAPGAVQVARLAMALEVATDVPAPAPPQTVHAAAARTAFASYASQDRPEVLERVSSIRRSAGLEVFIDVVDLRMGEQWEPALREHILACDRFLLFWSEHARDSRWVNWEWQQALDAKGDEVLELHLLRHVPAEGIPERLRKFHFNDIYLQARDAELHRRGHAALSTAP